jgi:hypothetical protein
MPDEVPGAPGGILHKKLGKFEYWQIGVGVVGLFGVYLAYKSFSGGSSATTAATTASPLISTTPATDLGTTGAGTALSGQLADLQTSVGNLATQVAASSPQAVQANGTPGSSSGAVGGFANWAAFENSPAALSLADTNPNAYVTAQYQSILGRAPDAAGQTFWEGQLGTAPTAATVTQENQAFQAATANEIAQRQVSTGQ